MHPAAMRFVERAVRDHIRSVSSLRVLEIGSLDVNGSARPLFDGCAKYVGIDRQAGRGVDEVIDARHYNGDGWFDVVITTEALEHDPDPQEIVRCAERALKPGGLLLITCAGAGREPHTCLGHPWQGGEHYANVEVMQLLEWLAGWIVVEITVNPIAHDLYAIARKE